jgi:hypothetical protein
MAGTIAPRTAVDVYDIIDTATVTVLPSLQNLCKTEAINTCIVCVFADTNPLAPLCRNSRNNDLLL